ncbi:MAG: phosphatidylinositol-specific phospholipase C1-like protein [Erythrobacter sp.]
MKHWILVGALAISPVQVALAGPLDCASPGETKADCAAVPEDLKLNDLQSVGSHNSYKIAIPAAELAIISAQSQEAAEGLDYGHAPLNEQLDLGMRQLEIDIYYDPDGGRFADPLLPRISGEPFDASQLHQPGFKVFHTSDIDVRSHCLTLVACLEEIEAWSDAHPGHAPILILFNTKSSTLPIPGATEVLPFTKAAFEALDAELRQVLAPGDFIEPDDVRGTSETLREAVMQSGWPSLADSRGQLLLALDSGSETVTAYLRGNESLEGLPMFVNTLSLDAPHAAYFTINEPQEKLAEIEAAVSAGMIVRTRADADTKEARSGDVSRRETAFASGAQYVSTDYYVPRAEWSQYSVNLPGSDAVRCNPHRTSATCGDISNRTSR